VSISASDLGGARFSLYFPQPEIDGVRN